MGLGQRGMLQVKQALERLQLSSFNGQSNTPAFCLVEWIKNMISGLSESFEVDSRVVKVSGQSRDILFKKRRP